MGGTLSIKNNSVIDEDLDSPGATIIICFPYDAGLNFDIPSSSDRSVSEEEIKIEDEENGMGSENIETEVREFLEGDRNIGDVLNSLNLATETRLDFTVKKGQPTLLTY